MPGWSFSVLRLSLSRSPLYPLLTIRLKSLPGCAPLKPNKPTFDLSPKIEKPLGTGQLLGSLLAGFAGRRNLRFEFDLSPKILPLGEDP